MASRAATSLFDASIIADRWIADYRAHAPAGDVLGAGEASDPGWSALFEELATLSGESLAPARERAQHGRAQSAPGGDQGKGAAPARGIDGEHHCSIAW